MVRLAMESIEFGDRPDEIRQFLVDIARKPRRPFDLQTLVCRRGRVGPLARIDERLRCLDAVAVASG
jgi:hypothetical protein